MTVYTRGGDKGYTSRLNGDRASKSSEILEANGVLDELSASIGFVKVKSLNRNLPGAVWDSLEALLLGIQQDLTMIGAAISSGDPKTYPIPVEKARAFEEQIDVLQAETGPITEFIIPGANELEARLHLARCVCRRAERRLAGLPEAKEAQEAVIYLNRLADLIFILAVWLR
jgi:cob(I)alamin adenosyltransferase